MHGVRRAAYKREKTPKEKIALHVKTKKYMKLSSKLLALRKARNFSKESLALTDAMLSRSVDFYTIWNFRREILQHLLQNASESEKSEAYEKELTLVAHGLSKRNPKSYSLWYHRQWVIEKGLSDLKRELELCTKFLRKDERNFHCWSYRLYISSRLNVPVEDELSFTMTKIEENFSNFSAWHYRMTLLPRLLSPNNDEENVEKIISLINSEMELVQQAIFTEPDDSSSWLHLRWVLEWGSETLHKTNSKLLQEGIRSTVLEGISNCRQIIELEGENKWALVTLVFLLQLQQKLDGKETEINEEEIKSLIGQLVMLDPIHVGYYRDISSIHHE
eukprot:g4435.t1